MTYVTFSLGGFHLGRPGVRGEGGSAKSGLTIYFLYRTKRKNRGQGGRGGQFSAENRGRPLWKAPNVYPYPKIVVLEGVSSKKNGLGLAGITQVMPSASLV